MRDKNKSQQWITGKKLTKRSIKNSQKIQQPRPDLWGRFIQS